MCCPNRARQALRVQCEASKPSRRSALAAPVLLLPSVAAAPAGAAAAACGADGPWAFHRRQLLSLLSVSSDYNR